MELIFVLYLSLVHLSLLQGADAAVQHVMVTSGSSATFYCPVESTTKSLNIQRCECSNYRTCSGANIPWTKIQQDWNQWKITLDDLTPSDSGCFRCSQQNWWLVDWNLAVLPGKDPSVVIGKSGESAVMSCLSGEKVSASEKYWCREDQSGSCLRISLNDPLGRFRIEDPQGTFSLVKQDLSSEDSGKYRCVVNQERTSSHTIDLQVLQNRNGLSAPLTVNVLPGQTFKVSCKYIQEYVNATKTWECYRTHCKSSMEVTDDRTRSELVLSVEYVDIRMNKDIYTCKVAKSDGVVTEVSVILMVGLTAPKHVNGTKGGDVEIRCNYSSTGNIWIFWCKPDSNGICVPNNERVTIKAFFSYFVVTMKRLEMNDAGLYLCGYKSQKNNETVSADVHLSVVEPQVSSTPSAVTKKRSMHRPSKTISTAKPLTLRSNSLLYGIFFLLSFIAVSLLIILLKLYCKRRSERVQSPDLGGGTFQMNDLKTNIHLLSPDLPLHQHPYTGTLDDSSSTSSESSGHSFGNISSGPRPQYLTIIPCPRNPDYENVSEGMHPALSDYENVPTDVEQDYVNVPEAPNSSFTEDKECESCQPPENCGQNDNTSESSSDESDEEAVNYTTVVFTKTTE